MLINGLPSFWHIVEYSLEVDGVVNHIKLREVPGAAGVWHLTVNNRHWGQFGTRLGKWTYLPQNIKTEYWFTWGDMLALCDVISDLKGAD